MQTSKTEIKAIAASLAADLAKLHEMGYIQERAYTPGPRDVARDITELLKAKGFTLKIEWVWSGRNRDGVVSIFDRAQTCVYSGTYARAETRWDANDELLTSCNRGSNKHFALIAALAFMRKLPRRKCGGISDTLVS